MKDRKASKMKRRERKAVEIRVTVEKRGVLCGGGEDLMGFSASIGGGGDEERDSQAPIKIRLAPAKAKLKSPISVFLSFGLFRSKSLLILLPQRAICCSETVSKEGGDWIHISK